MVEKFEFSTVGEIHFGRGVIERSGRLAAKWGKRAFVVTGKNPGRAEPLLAALGAVGVAAAIHPIQGEPEILEVSGAVEAARRADADLIFGFGGGSAIDAAKSVAGLLTNPGEITDYLEVVGEGKALANPAMPWIAVPTTAGTGAEVTRNAVLSVPDRRLKVSLRSPYLLARAAVVDPDLTRGLPQGIAAETGMDALTQLIESYLSTRANPLTDALCESAIPLAARSLEELVSGELSDGARSGLSWSALASGLALANSGLGAVHGLGAPIGGGSGIPHGRICATLLAPVLALNARALRAREPASPVLARFGRVGAWLADDAASSADEGVEWVRDLVRRLGIRSLGPSGVMESELRNYAEASLGASSMKANPVQLAPDELIAAMREAL